MKVGVYAEHIGHYLEKEAPFLEVVNLKHEESAKKDVEVLVKGSLKRFELQPYAKLKAMIVPFSGLDSISKEAVEEAGIDLYNCHAHAPFVAERALALLLSLAGNVVRSHRALSEGQWIGRDVNDANTLWRSIRGMKVGLLGYGAIGKNLHDLLKPFGCRILILDRGKAYPEGTTLMKSVEALVEQADAIVLSLPLTAGTEGLVDAELLSRMKGKYLVNVGRGLLVDEDALYHAVVAEELAGFASDVWYQYPEYIHAVASPSKYDFSRFGNVVMTPHSAGFEKEAEQRILEELRRILKGLQEGEKMEPVALDRFY